MFDVVIPAYNASLFLAETLDAIAKQTLQPNKVIVVDDGSIDNTYDIACRYAPMVSCIQVDNGGQGLARRIGIEKSSSDWIALCDSDDVWNADHLERRADLIASYGDAVFTYSDCFSFGPMSEENHNLSSEAPSGWHEDWETDKQELFFRLRDPYRAFLKFNPAFPSGMAFRRNAYHKMGGFLPKYSRWSGEDAEFTRRFLLLPDISVVGDANQTWGYRRHVNNFSKDQWKNIYSKAQILTEHVNERIIPDKYLDDVSREIDRALVRAFDQAYWSHSKDGVIEVWGNLPIRLKTLKRKIKYYISMLN
ncbi:MAG: glycosyltransferase family 2 protein [Paludibacteraceae bacterium]|nr:glycosyltransferase family 2 protein [Paludibacteraceae bacterium]